GGDQVVSRRHLGHTLKERAILCRRLVVDGLEERGWVPARGDPGGEERLGLRGQEQDVAPPRIIQRLDAESVPRGEESMSAAVPQHKREFTAQFTQALHPTLLVKVQGDLTVRTGPKAMTAAVELPLNSFEIIEFAVDDDLNAIVLTGDG